MVYLNPSQYKPCLALEDNFEIILKDYQNFLFDVDKLNDLDSQDKGVYFWEKGHEKAYHNTDVYNYADSYETYQKAPDWYGVKSNGDISIWDAVLLATKVKPDKTILPELRPSPVCKEFFNDTLNLIKIFSEVINIQIARLPPDGSLPKHRGFKELNRVHFGLVVPVGDMGLSVDGLKTKWEVGKCLVFNDGREHYIWNHTKMDRIILIMDLFGG